jgi:hypothetical protein
MRCLSHIAVRSTCQHNFYPHNTSLSIFILHATLVSSKKHKVKEGRKGKRGEEKGGDQGAPRVVTSGEDKTN